MTVRATRFGRPLAEGGCIGVPAPASPWENRSDLLRGVEWWQARGYRVKLADGIEARDSYVAGDAKGRARDLEAMFADPEVDVVQCLTGGFGSMQLLPHLDFDLVAEHPKAFLGYSDITALHVALRQRAGLATFYGPHLWTMGARGTSELTRGRLLEVLRGDGTWPGSSGWSSARWTSATGASSGRSGRGPSRWSRSSRSASSPSACRSSTGCRSATPSTWPPCRSA